MAASDHPFYNNLMTTTLQTMSDIDVAQTAYMAAHGGKPFQGILTPATPLDGTGVGDMDTSLKPTDETDDWNDFAPVLFPQNKKLPYQIKSDIYELPDNSWGYIITTKIYYAGLDPDAYGNMGDCWIYRHHVGLGIVDGVFDEYHILTEVTE